MACRGGLLGICPNVRPGTWDSCGFEACLAALNLDVKPPGLLCECLPDWPNTDFEADGGGPIGVVEGMGSRLSERSGVEGGSEYPGTLKLMLSDGR
jgi:hypothetical protein